MSAPAPLLFISGWGATREMWLPVVERMPEAQAHFLDGLDDWPSALSRILSATERQLVLVGWSLGALLALKAAHEFPDKVAALVLVSAMPYLAYGTEAGDGTARMLKTMRLRLGRNAAAVLQEFAGQCMAPDGDARMQSQFLQQAQTHTAEQLAAGLKCLGALDMTRQLEAMTLPCALLHGSKDRIVPLKSARLLAAALPHSQLTVFEERGHALPFTVPHEIVQQIRSVFP